MLVFGISFALLGAILPLLLARMDLTLEHAGLLFIALNGGGLSTTLVGGMLLDRRGYRQYLMVSGLTAAAGLFVIGAAADLSVLLAGCFLLGVGGGGLNLGTNALTSDLYAGRPGPALNQLGLFFGVGTLLAPLGLGLLIATVGLSGLLQLGGVIAVTSAGLFLWQRFPQAKLGTGLPLPEVVRRLSAPKLKLLGVALFFQSGNEMTIGGWLTTYFVQHYSASAEQAALVLSLFWGALIAGRLAASRILVRMSASGLVVMSACGSWVLLAVLAGAVDQAGLGALLAVLMGLMMAPLFPTLLSQASSAAPDLSATALAVVLLPTTIGAMFFPWLAGQLASAYGVSATWWIPLVCFLMVAALQRLASRQQLLANSR